MQIQLINFCDVHLFTCFWYLISFVVVFGILSTKNQGKPTLFLNESKLQKVDKVFKYTVYGYIRKF